MRTIRVIGIGAGDPEHVTVQAINALNATDVFFLVDKGEDKRDLLDLRREVCDRYVEGSYRAVVIQEPPRDRTSPDYRSAVEDWRQRRADAFEAAIRDELAENDRGAFLAWGDPAIYDSTLGILEEIVRRGELEFELEVVPGISSIQALAARHGVSLTRVGRPLQITTGRLLAEGLSEDVEDVVVMLDGQGALGAVEDELDVYWGAYVGSDDEVLVSGDLNTVRPEIERMRAEARERKGWVMDTYLLRRRRR
ncbi:MAG: precorrin-6A synthase (deacetylating) [Gaiellaceae bacterium]